MNDDDEKKLTERDLRILLDQCPPTEKIIICKNYQNIDLTRRNIQGFLEFTNKKDGSILVWIPAGSFQMGSIIAPPVHEVHLDGYLISKHEITFEQYDRFCEKTGRNNPSDNGWGREKRPVINVSWHDAKAYCDWAGLPLPTEAQWEKAAKGGENFTYSGSDDLSEVGWYEKNSGKRIQPVGQKKPNGYGLFDMSGNVWEWCEDWYDAYYYSKSPKNNPKGPDTGSNRVLRGGSWYRDENRCSNEFRSFYFSDTGRISIGFRPVKNLE